MTGSRDKDAKRLDILVLVPHEPGLDPRIHYTASALARRHTVTVLATVLPRQSRSAAERVAESGYDVVRIPCPLVPWPGVFLQFLRLAWQSPKPPLAPLPPEAPYGNPQPLSWWKRVKANLIYLLLTGGVNHALQKALRAAPRRPDVIFCHDLYTLQTGVVLKQQTGAKLAYDSHEYYPYQYMHPTFVGPTLWYERKLVPFVDLYMTISPELAVELSRVFGVPDVAVIPNAEPTPVGPVLPLGTEMARLAAGRRKFLYQGNFVEGRGLEEIVGEWTKVDAGRAALFLRGPQNAVQAALKDRVDRMGLLGKSVYFLPPVLEKDLIAAAAEADVGIIPYKGDLPSYRFACPNKLSQYMHAGLAILTNDIPFVARMTQAHEAGWVYDVRQPGSCAAQVAAALDDDALRHCRANSSALAATTYRWETYEMTLHELVGRLGGAASAAESTTPPVR